MVPVAGRRMRSDRSANGERMPTRLDSERLIDAYRRMKTIREFEERLHVEIATGEIPGFTHLYAGQEAVAVGVCEHLDDRDYIVSTHRGHGHCIAKGCDVTGMMNEIYGRRDGLCNGKGGSMHIADVDARACSARMRSSAADRRSPSVRPSPAGIAATGGSASRSAATAAATRARCSRP